MIVQKDGEQFTVNTTSKSIDVILYFPKLNAEENKDVESKGSMTDKGKELIDQAREVQLKKENNSAEQLDKVLSNYNSTRHKSRQGYPLNILDECALFPFRSTATLNTAWEKVSDFREDRLSNGIQERQKGLAEQKVFKEWESEKQLADYIKTLDEVSERLSGYKETANKSDYSEINLGILDLMADRFSANKGKYEHGNSKKPLDKQQILWALFRHVKKMVQPIEGDEENFRDHLAACLTNCSILLDQLEIKK